MEPTLLIDAIVRQTTVLIAQLATSAGLRAPLAQSTLCLCGKCTLACADDDACASAPAGAVCAPTTEAQGCSVSEDTGHCVATTSSVVLPANPTGQCSAPDSGARVGAPVSGKNDVWFPDCNLKLGREYWRVFVRPTGTAYILPDPTGAGGNFVNACADSAHPLYDIVTRYSFCNPPSSNRPSDRMTVVDALAVTHFYHRGGYVAGDALAFIAASPGILPTPFLADVLDACKLADDEDAPEFGALCGRATTLLASEADGGDSSTDANLIYEGQAGADIAYHLNQLYGIDAERMPVPIDPTLCGVPADATSCQSTSDRYFYDPVTAKCEPRPYGSCGTSLRDFPTEAVCERACARRARSCERCNTGESCPAADDCSACPITAPDTAVACSEPGLSCSYGRCSPTCVCGVDSGGTLTWTCTSLLC